jgi:cytoskeleton protein RodZ
MPPIGDTLRRERLRRNLELPQIAQELKIAPRFLQAIEEERFDDLPATVFAKNFVRQYAALLELDGEELSVQAQRLLEARTVAPDLLPAAAKPDVPELPIQSVQNWNAASVSSSSSSSWITAAALFVAAMLVCSAAYWWWERPRLSPVTNAAATSAAPAAKVAEPAAQQPVTQQPAASAPETSTPPVTPPAEAPAQTADAQKSTAAPLVPTSAVPAPTAMTPALESNPNASVRVEITALDTVWVRARVNGKYVFSATLQPQQTRNVDADGTVELLLGNAGGASIALNGKPLSQEGFPSGTVGPKGQVRLIQLTSGGFQIVPSKPEDPRDR